MESSISIKQTAENDFESTIFIDQPRDIVSSISVRRNDNEDIESVLTTKHPEGVSELEVTMRIMNEYPRPKRPTKIVTETVLTFLRAVFDDNYKKGNWHLDPVNEMYIRDHYPENIGDSGVKPGIVTGKQGGVRQGIRGLGELNFIPMDPKNINQFHGDDEILSGNMNLKTISPVRAESEDMAYLTMLSINKFVNYLIGVNGIAHIHSVGYQDTMPEDSSSEVKLWATQVMLEFVIRVPFSSIDLEGTTLESIEFQGG